MAPEKSFIDWLATRLYQAGTRRLFGVPGGGTSLDLIDAAARQGIEMVLCAREDAAVIMAGVAGVLAEAPGLAFTTKGPGLASAANGLASASLDRMPTLLVTETFAPGDLDYVSHQVFDQAAMATPLLQGGRDAVLAADPAAVDGWLTAGPKPPRAPAVMFPTAAELRQRTPPGDGRRSETSSIDYSMEEIERAREMLAGSRNPVLVVGLEAARGSVVAPLLALVERLGAPALTTYMASGTIPVDHPNYAGIFTGGAIEQVCVGEADLIVLVGLDPVELIRKPWTYRAAVLDLCEVARQPHYMEPELRLRGNLEDSLGTLSAGDGGGVLASTWTRERIKAHRERFHEELLVSAEEGLSSSEVVKMIAAGFAGRPRLSVDAGAHMFSACAFWPARQPRDVLISNGLASMGFAIPAAIAAALHDPVRGAVAMTGDGGAMMCLGELKTAAQTGANICVVIFNDGRLSLIDIKREERQMSDLGLSWQRPDFATVAAGFGFRTWRATTVEELRVAADEAAGETGPCVIDAWIDSSGYLPQMKALRG